MDWKTNDFIVMSKPKSVIDIWDDRMIGITVYFTDRKALLKTLSYPTHPRPCIAQGGIQPSVSPLLL